MQINWVDIILSKCIFLTLSNRPITDGDDRNTQSFHVHYEYASQAKYDQANRNAKQVNAMGSTLGVLHYYCHTQRRCFDFLS